jgi:class 3 adenylate cyclase/ligand-binding sensor protein
MSSFSLEELGIENIDDLIDPEYLQNIRDTFAKSTGIEIILGTTEPGDYLVEAQPYHFCGQLREKPDFVNRCNQGYMARIGDVMSTEGVFVCECHLGMLMFGAPLAVEGQVLGTLGGCMVSPEAGLISRERCEEICKQYGYDGDLDRMHRSLGEFPVYPPDKLASTLEIFKEMAIALSEVAKRQYQIKVVEAKKERLSRYFSPSIFELIDGREELSYSGEASVLFSDIRNFTTRSERLTPAEVVEMLNEYFEEMVEAIFAHEGTLDKFIGDAVLAVFGAPIPSEENARNAVKAAQQMLTKLAALNEKRTARGQQPIEIGIGIHTGKIMGGNIGSKKRMEYTVIGDTVNVAARLESLSKNYPEAIIISEDTFKMVQDLVDVAGAEEVQLKGKTAATRIHRVTDVRV